MNKVGEHCRAVGGRPAFWLAAIPGRRCRRLAYQAFPTRGRRLYKSSNSVYCFLYSQTVNWRGENNFRATRGISLTMKVPVNSTWDGVERRKPQSCRRKAERRAYRERRCDTRDGSRQNRRSFYGWLRALIQARLGVDRRKNVDRRQLSTRRRLSPRSLITKEELADLLK